MAKNKKAPPREETRAAAEYYKLNTKAVEDLVSADESNSPVVSEEELNRYTKTRKLRLPEWLKIVLIKLWFAGAVCYFLFIGTVLNVNDQIIVTGVVLGFVWDLLLNNLLTFMEKTPGANSRWIFINFAGYISLPLNAVYGFVLVYCAARTYEGVNGLLTAMMGADAVIPVEPILFGTFIMAWDTLFLQMKRVLKSIVADAKKKARSGS